MSAPLSTRIRHSRPVRLWRRHIIWRIEGRLLAWTESAEPCDDYSARLLAENEDGDWLAPSRTRPEWWSGYWRWWRPDHWPVYIRSWRRKTYVMVEREWLS